MRIATQDDINEDTMVAGMDCIDRKSPYRVGDMYKDIGRIMEMFQHCESDCCWIYVLDQYGNLWNIDISEEVIW